MYETIRFNGTQEEVNEQWLEARKNGIGGSDASAILGLNKYATPYTVWLEKTGRVEADDLSGNEKVYWGNVLEDVIAKEFEKRHPEYFVREPGEMYVSKEHPFMLASVDRMLHGQEISDSTIYLYPEPSALLEVKTCGEWRKSDWDEGVPPYYLAQVNHYLAVTGLDEAWVAVLIGGQEYREYNIKRDEYDIAYLIEKEAEFWKMVQDDVMPPVTNGEIDGKAVLDQFPEDDGGFLQLPDSDVPDIQTLDFIKAQIKDLEGKKKEIEASLKQRIGGRKGIETELFKVTWSRGESSRFDSKRFASENHELYNEYMVPTKRDNGLRIKSR